MTEPPRPLKVFLCHAHSDKAAVRKLYQRLVDDSIDAWLDKEKLLPGQDWELEIRRAVREADVVVVCLSKQFNQAGFRQKEVRLALDTAMEQPEGEIFIIPARLEECDTLESLRQWHWVDLFEDDGYERLIRALRTRAVRLGTTLQIKLEEKVSKAKEPPRANSSVSTTETPKNIKMTLSPSLRLDSTSIINEVVESDKRSDLVKSSQSPTRKSKIKTEYMVAIIGAVATIIAGLLGSPIIERWLSSPSTLSPTAIVAYSTQANTPSYTTEASQTPKPSPVVTATDLPSTITDDKGVEMVLVSAGEFLMGADDQAGGFAFPPHRVYVDSFYIDKYEAYNKSYNDCVDAGVCTALQKRATPAPPVVYQGNNLDYPVVYISWVGAQTYCAWRGGQLPSEAQWEKAARGPESFLYPWGNEYDYTGCSRGNYGNCSSQVTGVFRFDAGASPYGAVNMYGNVFEWVNDWFSDVLDSETTRHNPTGPSTGVSRVIKGGSFAIDGPSFQLANRAWRDPQLSYKDVGFRCIKTVP